VLAVLISVVRVAITKHADCCARYKTVLTKKIVVLRDDSAHQMTVTGHRALCLLK